METGISTIPYVTRPLYANYKGMKIGTDEFLAIVRGPIPATEARTEAVDTWDIISVVSPKYELITPEKIFGILDHVADRTELGDKAFPVMGLGLLQQGRRLFASMEMGMVNLFGDGKEDAVSHLFLGQDFRPGRALELCVGITNVVCANTWQQMLDSNQARIAIPHFKGAADQAAFALEIIKQAHNKQEGAVAYLRQLMATPVTEEQVIQMIESIYPMPAKIEKDAPIIGTIFDQAAINAVKGTVKASTVKKNQERVNNAQSENDRLRALAMERQNNLITMWHKYLDVRGTGMNLYTAGGAILEGIERRDGKGDAALQIINPEGVRSKELRSARKALQSVLKP